MRRLLPLSLLFSAGITLAADPGAFDWPQWRGPDRSGLSKETGLLKDWPKDGPKQLWKITGLGDGYSTPSISSGKIYVLGTKGNDEYLICLEEKNGERVWDTRIGQMAGDRKAPRSTPTIDNGFAYVVSSDGNLNCVEIEKGTLKWQKNYKKDFGGRSGGWAYSESPLVDGDLVIGTPGADSAALVALKKSNGETVWKTTIKGISRKPSNDPKRKPDNSSYSRAGYSSAVAADIGGVRQYVQFIDGGVIGVNAADGALLWHYEEPANQTANCSTPIVRGDLVFAASGYGTGGGQAKIVKDGSDFKVEQTYFVKQMQNHHGGMVLVKDHVYGTSGSLLCVDFKTGKIAWDDRCVGKGSVTYADGMLYVRGEGGKIALVEANPNRYVEHGQFMQPDRSKQSAWPHPVVANGKLYIRDWDILLCYDVKNK